MSEKNEFLNGFVLAVIIIFLLAAAAVLKFSSITHLDVPTSIRVMTGMCIVCGVSIVILKLSFDAEYFYALLPLLVAGLWASWWPAMDYWAWASPSAAMIPTDENGFIDMPWYATSYVQYGVAVFIIAVGYGIRKIVMDGRRD